MKDSSNSSTRKKIFSFVKQGVIRTFSREEDRTNTVEILKGRSVGLFMTFKDFFALIGSGIVLLVLYIISIFFQLKDIPSQTKRACKNNFQLGIDALKTNNILDARIRFLLANFFFKKSATIKYYIAYTYFLERKTTKSLKYLKQALELDSSHKRAKALLLELEKNIK